MTAVSSRRISLFAAVVIALGMASVRARALTLGYRGGATNVVLRTADDAQQVLATEPGDAGTEVDVSRSVTWSVEPANLAKVDAGGRLTPLADGTGVLVAAGRDGKRMTLPLWVEAAKEPRPINFANRIVPIFTKNGCNGGGCHGKIAGQNGFRLSLLGFEPGEDYEHLVKEARGRRLFPAAPERSLLLQKGAAILPHGGGARFDPASDDWKLLVRWIGQGMPAGAATDPVVTNIEVYPSERILPRNGEQQLVVTAHLSDGTHEDVTRGALFEANDKDMAAVDAFGRVKAADTPGEVAVMVRYQGRIAVFRATVPLGAAIAQLPPAKTFVDELVFKQLKKVGMPPSAVCDDATFLRRVTIDIAGRIPTPDELSAFLKDGSEGGRDAVVDRLLASNDYAEYFANKWSALLRNKRNSPKDAHGAFAFHDWIREAMARNKPYDQFVREVVAASGEIADNPPVVWYRQEHAMQTQLEDTAQLFLGVRLQCAQCHHHPYDKWSQADYWSFGAFFSQVGYDATGRLGEETVGHRRGMAQATNKKTGKSVGPAALGDSVGDMSVDDDPRQRLADWLASPKNRYFARALANRYWKHFFNRGLVEPEDDMRETNPATNPELLDALAANFIRSGFDLKHLVRTLATSTVYQLSAEPNEFNAKDRHHFARYYPKRLNAEVLYDAVNAVVAAKSHFEGVPDDVRAVALPDNSFNASSYFLTVFGRPESSSACECERSADASLSQSLHLLNSKEIQERLANDASRAARLALDAAHTDEVKLQDLYRLAYSRDPKPDEVRFAVDYIRKKTEVAKDEAAKAKSRREAYEDAVWALLNTKEFLFNH
jgi:Protein of unknown function (DUF1549)/Protein of unknown function (DUF1553)